MTHSTPLFIDVRSAPEFRTGFLEGAINLPLDRLAQQIQSQIPDTGRELVLYCASGGRSGLACALLQTLGYQRVRNGGGLGLLALSTGRPVLRP
jgi:phage shock protein E